MRTALALVLAAYALNEQAAAWLPVEADRWRVADTGLIEVFFTVPTLKPKPWVRYA